MGHSRDCASIDTLPNIRQSVRALLSSVSVAQADLGIRKSTLSSPFYLDLP